MTADKSNDSHAQFLNFLLASRIDIEGDGEAPEHILWFLFLFIHFAVIVYMIVFILSLYCLYIVFMPD